MRCMFHYTSRPPKSAKKSRTFWDEMEKAHGRQPTSLGLYISEGGFRDWYIEMGDDDFDFEDALIGAPSIIDPVKAAESTIQIAQRPK